MNFSIEEILHESDDNIVDTVAIIVGHGQIQEEKNARHGGPVQEEAIMSSETSLVATVALCWTTSGVTTK